MAGAPSPGLADAALADDKDLQGSQHVLVHPGTAPGATPTDAPFAAYDGLTCACAPRRPVSLAPSAPAHAPQVHELWEETGKTPPPCAWRMRTSAGAEPPGVCLQRAGKGPSVPPARLRGGARSGVWGVWEQRGRDLLLGFQILSQDLWRKEAQ